MPAVKIAKNPFRQTEESDALKDRNLISAALEGETNALESLIIRHQPWLFNLAIRMVLNPQEAEDITQEVLIKIITKLSTYDPQKAAFRTWAYRIVTNHVINMKKGVMEGAITDFESYGQGLDAIPNDMSLETKRLSPEEAALVQDAKIGCMLGMLLCLDREQRLVYILGEIFGAADTVGGELLSISRENFRKRLSRARRDISAFMNDQCGLINKNNPCRCRRKASGFVKAGWVDPKNLQFYKERLQTVRATAGEKSEELCDMEAEYSRLFTDNPFYDSKEHIETFRRIINHPRVIAVFNLN